MCREQGIRRIVESVVGRARVSLSLRRAQRENSAPRARNPDHLRVRDGRAYSSLGPLHERLQPPSSTPLSSLTVTLTRPDPPTSEPHIPTSRAELRKAVTALEDETTALTRQAAHLHKLQLTKATTADLPPYAETDLERFYHRLMTTSPAHAHPLLPAPSDPPRARIPKKERKEIIIGLVTRLEAYNVPLDPIATTAPNVPVKGWRVAQRQRAIQLIDSVTALTPTTSSTLQTGLISRTEFLALFDECIGSNDLGAAERILERARAHGLAVPLTEVRTLLDAYAASGDVVGVGKLLKREEELHGSVPRPHLEALVHAHLAAGETHQAVRVLHNFESRNLTLHEPAYRSVIDRLLAPTPTMKQADKALAWDLFTHMRLVAHPIPSVETYNTMIRSCADPKDPQPELALDMFTQMVVENRQTPVAETYNVLIRALAKVKTYYYEAFRVLRQMLEVHRSALDSAGPTGYEPTVVTFNALLEGTKRTGDLGRARWILAEMAKIGAFMGDQPDTRMMPNEETLVGVFHTYAAFRPVVARADVKVVQGVRAGDVEERDASATPQSTEEQADPEPPQVSLLDIGSPDFVPPYQPQTAYEVFTEATQLFDLVLANAASQQGVFSNVRPTSRLLNAYLSVGLAHATLDRAIRAQLGLWHDQRVVQLHDVKPNGWTFLFALERCAAAKNKTEKRLLIDNEVLETLWAGYLRWYAKEDNMGGKIRTSDVPGDLSPADIEKYRMNVGLGPREVERCWVAAIRGFALIENTSRALDLLGEFRDRFPPDAIISAYKPSPRFANKIRFSSPHRTLEDDIPPHILFHDMEILHHRFVRDGNLQGVGKIKWITLGYQLALEKRKSMRMAEKVPRLDKAAGVLESSSAGLQSGMGQSHV